MRLALLSCPWLSDRSFPFAVSQIPKDNTKSNSPYPKGRSPQNNQLHLAWIYIDRYPDHNAIRPSHQNPPMSRFALSHPRKSELDKDTLPALVPASLHE